MEFIKGFEGFSKYVRSDSSHYYIGYGTSCKPGDYPNGITREEAHRLLYKAIQKIRSTLDKFLEEKDISLNQHQYDALLSFCYNLGTAWLKSTSRLRTCLIEGVENYTDVEFADALAIWCHIGKTVNRQLLNRRIAEARLFLYGDYGSGESPNFKYLVLEPGGAEIVADVVIYEYNKPYGTLPDAVLEGYMLEGWYADDGEKITADMLADRNLRVFARFVEGVPEDPVAEDPVPEDPGVPVLYSDVNPDDWFYTYVSDLSNSNIISGFDDRTFRPGEPTTFGQALKLILLVSGYEPQAAAGGHWASGYLETAVIEEIVEESSITDLDKPIDRLSVARIAAKALKLPESHLDTPFADTDDTHVLALYETGIITGSSDNGNLVYKPQDNIKRSELSAVIWRIKNHPDFSLLSS
jgi:lysozyme